MKKKLVYDTNERPPLGKWFILSLQHVFAMLGATILVPILINESAGSEVITVPLALVTSGIGTLIYIFFTNGKSPVYLGSSFAFITPVVIAYKEGGISAFTTGIISVGIIYIIFALLIKLFGKNWIDKLLPPIVVGPMIIIIGLSLAPHAISQIGLTGENIAWQNIIVAFVSFFATALVAICVKGFLKVIPFLVGIFTGYIFAIMLNMVDFAPIIEASVFELPRFLIPFKDYSFSLTGLLTMAPLALVSIAEHIGDHMALGNIIGKDLIKDPGLDRTLLGDGFASVAAGLVGGPANTTYGENTSVVGMSKVASVWVTGLAAIIAICMGFLGKVVAIFSSIPEPVLGGVSLLLYGFISVNGLKVLTENKIDFNNIRNVIIASTMLILGLGGAVISFSSSNLSFSITGMSLAALIGILLNLVLPEQVEE